MFLAFSLQLLTVGAQIQSQASLYGIHGGQCHGQIFSKKFGFHQQVSYSIKCSISFLYHLRAGSVAYSWPKNEGTQSHDTLRIIMSDKYIVTASVV